MSRPTIKIQSAFGGSDVSDFPYPRFIQFIRDEPPLESVECYDTGFPFTRSWSSVPPPSESLSLHASSTARPGLSCNIARYLAGRERWCDNHRRSRIPGRTFLICPSASEPPNAAVNTAAKIRCKTSSDDHSPPDKVDEQAWIRSCHR